MPNCASDCLLIFWQFPRANIDWIELRNNHDFTARRRPSFIEEKWKKNTLKKGWTNCHPSSAIKNCPMNLTGKHPFAIWNSSPKTCTNNLLNAHFTDSRRKPAPFQNLLKHRCFYTPIKVSSRGGEGCDVGFGFLGLNYWLWWRYKTPALLDDCHFRINRVTIVQNIHIFNFW